MREERHGASESHAAWEGIGVSNRFSWDQSPSWLPRLGALVRPTHNLGIARYGALAAGLILVHAIELPHIGIARIVAAANGRSDADGFAPIDRRCGAPRPL